MTTQSPCLVCGASVELEPGQSLPVCADCLEPEQEQERCPVCDAVCVSCAIRVPEYDTPYGPLCGTCVGNGQAEPYTEECPDHAHPQEEYEMGAFWGGGLPTREFASRELPGPD